MANMVLLVNVNSPPGTSLHHRSRAARCWNDCPSKLHPCPQTTPAAAEMERSRVPSSALSADYGKEVASQPQRTGNSPETTPHRLGAAGVVSCHVKRRCKMWASCHQIATIAWRLGSTGRRPGWVIGLGNVWIWRRRFFSFGEHLHLYQTFNPQVLTTGQREDSMKKQTPFPSPRTIVARVAADLFGPSGIRDRGSGRFDQMRRGLLLVAVLGRFLVDATVQGAD